MKYLYTILIILIATSLVKSQENKDWRLFPGKKMKFDNANELSIKDSSTKMLNFQNNLGSVKVIQTYEIDSLINKHRKNPYILGYTVQLEVSQQSSKIRDARYKLLKLQPDAPIEENYSAPNTYLYGGAFYTRTDAYEFKNSIKSYFPNAIVIARKLALPPLEKK